MGSEDAGVAARAAYRLGLLLRDVGDPEGAEVAFRAATASDDGEVMPRAAYQLGKTLHRRGRLAEAAAAFQRAIDSQHRICADLAVEALAHVRLSEHRVHEAKDLFLAASASQQAELAAHATLSLAQLWLWSGSDLDRAEAGLRRVIDSGFPNLLTPAWSLLGELLAAVGRGAEAEPLLRAAARDGDPTAMLDLAILILADSQPEAVEVVEHLGSRPQALSDRFVSTSAGLPAAMAARTESEFMASLETPMAPPAVLEEAQLLLRAALAAYALLAIAPVLPDDPDQPPPTDVGMIAPTIPEIQRLLRLILPARANTEPDVTFHLSWLQRRRRHQARARRHRYRRRHTLTA